MRVGKVLLASLCMGCCLAQVYSPRVLNSGQPDSSNLTRFANDIYRQAGATTPRERAEAVWRFFLTDGRFVKPGFWYHIAGWAYEEPVGEVLDPLKLLNSYGFGLCYHIAPLLEAVWKAGGFEDARVWFLTGHTVAEVFYDGAYHYYDSDMMGYNVVGKGHANDLPVASVHALERNPSIILEKLSGPRQADTVAASQPWYPADVRADAIGGLAELFTTTSDNHLFPFERTPSGHSMDYVMRPGERMVRYFKPEREGLYYLPYKWTGKDWQEFPQEIAEYQIRTADGPRSQKDSRLWATGLLEYKPAISADARALYEVRSPYVIIEAEFEMDAELSARQSLTLATSTDGGLTWSGAGKLDGPHQGRWRSEPEILTKSMHGRRTAVSGMYGYLIKLERSGGGQVQQLRLQTRVQLNPRSLPELHAGRNELVYSAEGPRVRNPVTPQPERVSNGRIVSDGAQGYWTPSQPGPAEIVFRLPGSVTAFDAGGRFLDLSLGLAPDKFTAEVRTVAPLPARNPAASIAWSTSPDGPFRVVWQYDAKLKWKDGEPIDRVLAWPEVDRHVELGAAQEIYVRYQIEDLALDSIRLAGFAPAVGESPLVVTHRWKDNGVDRTAQRHIPAGTKTLRYRIDIPTTAKVTNEDITFECVR